MAIKFRQQSDRYRRRYLLIALSLLAVACAGPTVKKGDTPEWINGVSSRYPATEYITGYGQAERLEQAQDRARANIAKVFAVEISEHSEDIQQLQQQDNGDDGVKHSSLDSRITRRLATETRQIISGIEIADVWQAAHDGEYYVLAVLPRQPAITRLGRQIRALDDSSEHDIARARDSGDALLSIRYASAAIEAQRQRAALQKMASIVDPNGRGVPPRWDVGRLEDDLADLLSRITVDISSDADHSQILTPMLAAAVTASGMQLAEAGKGEYVIAGTLAINDLGKHEDWYWLRATLTIRLLDSSDGRLRGTHTWTNVKVAGLDSATARQRLLDKLKALLKNELRPAILAMATP